MGTFSVDHLSPELIEKISDRTSINPILEDLEDRLRLSNWFFAVSRSPFWSMGPILRIDDGGYLTNWKEYREKGLKERMWGYDEAGRRYLSFNVTSGRYEPKLMIAHERYMQNDRDWVGNASGYALNMKMVKELLDKGQTEVSNTAVFSNCTECIRGI